jgi:hypothetical protein
MRKFEIVPATAWQGIKLFARSLTAFGNSTYGQQLRPLIYTWLQYHSVIRNT